MLIFSKIGSVVKAVHTNLFAKINGKLHKLATYNLNFETLYTTSGAFSSFQT